MDTVTPFVNTSIEYIKKFNPLDTTLFKTVSGFSIFRSKPKDISGGDVSGIDASSESFNDAPASGSSSGIVGAIMGVVIRPNGETILNLIMVLLYYILIILLASFVANSLIFAHWGLRLFGFLFVLYLTRNSPIFVIPLSAYYIIRALRNGYINFRDKPTDKLSLFPSHYAMLPIMTCRGTKIDFLNPFCYFKKGHDPEDAKFHFFKVDETKHKAELDSVVPNIQQIKGRNRNLVEKFETFLKDLNHSYIVVKGAYQAPKVLSAEEANIKAERDAIEQHITGAISKTIGAKSVDYIKSLGKVTATKGPAAATATATATPAAAATPAAK
jgi:hypothetical protein